MAYLRLKRGIRKHTFTVWDHTGTFIGRIEREGGVYLETQKEFLWTYKIYPSNVADACDWYTAHGLDESVELFHRKWINGREIGHKNKKSISRQIKEANKNLRWKSKYTAG